MPLLSLSKSLEFSKDAERSITESLFNKYSGLLYGIIIRIVKDQQSAEDVLQRVIRQMTVELKLPHSPHLKLITRMTQLARTLSNDKIKERPVSVSPSQPNNNFIQLPLPGLSQSERELVEGVILEGKSQQEIAQSLNIPLSVVRSKMRIAMQGQVSYTSEV